MSHWNHRVMRFTQPDGSQWLELHEVHYDDDVKPVAYTVNATDVSGESVEELRTVLDRMLLALAKPVLTPADFPGEA